MLFRSQSNIDCLTTCGASFGSGTQVTLTATPQSGYVFAGWSGACSGTGSCVVTMSMAENVTATFYATLVSTFVSGVGDDANPCTRTAPCKTFAGAISRTTAAGEINCLDPGGFGAVTITKSITLDCHGDLASVLVDGAFNGIVIQAGPNDRVVLRNIQVQGIGVGLVGIQILAAGAVTIEDCVVTHFAQYGIGDFRMHAGGKLVVKNTVVSLNTGAGLVAAGAATNNVTVDGLQAFGNGYGIATATGNNVTAKRSVLSANTTAGAEADLGAQLAVDDSAISGNGTGVQAIGAIRLSNSDIKFNTTAFAGTPTSYGNNRVFGNSALGSTPATASQR